MSKTHETTNYPNQKPAKVAVGGAVEAGQRDWRNGLQEKGQEKI